MEGREVMEVDVLFIGGGIASLSGALHLANLIKRQSANAHRDGKGQKLDEIVIAILEKGAFVGAHSISGAVMDPSSLQELVPDFVGKGAPLEGMVTKEEVCLLTKKGRLKSPFVPPPLNNRGFYVVSLAKLVEWLGRQVEEAGIDIFPGFAATEVIYDGTRVLGVRTGDKGIGPDGNKKSNYEPGIDLHAKVTVFGDGSRGNLTKGLIKKLQLDRGKNPSNYVVGVKEVWELPGERINPGEVIHTMGYPLKPNTYGGGFIYGMKNNMVSIGLMVGLDYKDPFLDPHREFQRFKLHPFVSELLQGGKLVQYGAKTVPVGGYFSIPQCYFDGGLIIGDAANLFISQKIKGIHVAMKSGMLAAETILEALLTNDFSRETLASYEKKLFDSRIGKDLYKVRNFHQAFQGGLWSGLIKGGVQYLLGGKILKDRLETEPDYTHLEQVSRAYGTDSPSEEKKGIIKYDGKLTFDKQTDVYYSGTTHEEQQPPHLRIGDLELCYNKCSQEYHNPCISFCPAGVYEIEVDETTGKREMRLNFSNCLHCKTCDIKDPYENISWVPPEGGGGPKYSVV